MKRKEWPLLLLALLLAVAPVLAQVSSNYDLSRHVIAGGGGRMASSGHVVMGTVGQAVTGITLSSQHTLCSGFWCGAAAQTQYRTYLPLVLR